jgi:hypothetical protein
MLFISYAREDRRVAAKLVNELEADGLACMIDPDLAEGDPFWREAVARQFPHCRLMVCLASAKADRSPWVEQEQRAFSGPKIRIALDRSAVGPNAAQPRSALRAIRAALTRPLGRPLRQRRLTARFAKADLRSRQMAQEKKKLAAFLRLHAGKSPARYDVAGVTMRLGSGAAELRLSRLGAEHGSNRTFIGLTPITNTQYRAFVDATAYPAPPTWQRAAFRHDEAPVTGVTWFEAAAFAAWVGGSLPEEPEWVAAARGGESGRRFATSSGVINHEVAYFGQPFARSAPVPVTAHAANPEGYFGLCGNTWDWCASARGSHRAIRGGGWMDAAPFCTIGSAYRNAPIDRDCCVGFRIKVTLDDV